MYRRKAMIVDPSEEFTVPLSRILAPGFQVTCCARGDEALELLRHHQVDVLILELALPGLDGIGLLRKLDQRPQILVVADLLSPFIAGALEELGVQYAMRKPCPLQTVADRATELAQLSQGLPGAGCALELFTRLGIPEGRQGFQHLLSAVPLLTIHRDQRLSKELYETISLHSNTSPSGVEKAIRDVIRAGWKGGDPAVWQQFFPGFTRCPKNKEFLFRMADILCCRKQCG